MTYLDILKLQLNNFTSKNAFWYSVSWAQVLLFLRYQQDLSAIIAPIFESCVVDDVANSGLTIVTKVSKEESESCYLVPEGYKLTHCQMYFMITVLMGSGWILAINLIYWAIYRFEIFEKFKI